MVIPAMLLQTRNNWRFPWISDAELLNWWSKSLSVTWMPLVQVSVTIGNGDNTFLWEE